MNNEVTMDEFLKDYDLKKLSTGDIIKGIILSVSSNEVIVNINYMKDGLLPKNEFVNNMEDDLNDVAKVGDEVKVMIVTLNDGEGNLILSKKRVDIKEAWNNLKTDYKNNNNINITIKEEVKGGVIGVDENEIRVFMPASQSSLNREKSLQSLIGKTFGVKIIELDKEKNKVVVSKRVLEEEILKNKKEKLWNELTVGEKRKGKVVKLTNFGAFVDIGGIQGLVHLNDLSWKRVIKPEEVVNIDDEVMVYIIGLDKEKNRLSLAIKDVDKNPWNTVSNDIKVNSIVNGKVIKIIQVGAIIELKDGIEGLVHISEISEERIAKPSDILTVGQDVRVKILDISEKNKRISLSIKDAIERPQEDFSKYMDDEESTLGDVLGDKLKGLFK
ncbi:30S ribosomal protein S1 [Clostridium frigidicarnis]|uniref:SSU ribosomal protein S1P n=1 Tax=Clostridium frigidicarnis TaxID=84698 RepID=A0A1I0XXN4_9CLOT|nr:30S ribosomal protein S1 [Clostridium frigidicarnis]SFB05427.1 SSU ribosomal protein S1P [Clostridium frigidicarnis]